MKRQPTASLGVETLESRQMLSASPVHLGQHLVAVGFTGGPPGSLPAAWAQWNSHEPFAVSRARAFDGWAGLAASAAHHQAARAWVSKPMPANVQVGTAVLLDSVNPIQVLARGRGLDTATPTYYAASVTRGLEVELLRVVHGKTTRLGAIRSTDYVSNRWVRLILYANGTEVRAQVYRPDRREYLNRHGHWQAAPAWALDVTDRAIPGGGEVGLARPAGAAGTTTFDYFTAAAVVHGGAKTLLLVKESFDTTAAGSLPEGWSQWSSSGPFTVSHGALGAQDASGQSSRVWLRTTEPANTEVSAGVFVNASTPGEILVRGQGLAGPSPSYYALAVGRGLQVELLRVVHGGAASLGHVHSAAYVSDQWIRATLSAGGTTLEARIYRPETGQYLNHAGRWQATPTWALDVRDGTIRGGGAVGLARPAGHAGVTWFEDFTLFTQEPAPTPTRHPVHHRAPQPSHPRSPTSRRHPVPTDHPHQHRDPRPSHAGGTGDPPPVPTGPGQERSPQPGEEDGSGSVPVIAIPRHYTHIRIAELAYTTLAFGPYEDQLLRNSVDLVVPSGASLAHIHDVAPGTPELLYTNTSSIYLGLLTDWLNYADAHGFSREEAFYHAAHPVPFSGASASSEPVTWFWGVYRGDDQGGSLTDFTGPSHSRGPAVVFGQAGESFYVGYPDEFREINLSLTAGARDGWSAELEYPTAVDSAGHPTAWGVVRPLSDGTHGLTRSGRVTFDPPPGWVPALVGGGARLYYVRFRTTSAGGLAPVARRILGRDYVNANGRGRGVIPAFDYEADKNHDGYLDDEEWAHRRPGYNARFVYESRVFLSPYGQMRPATNPADPGFRSWVIDHTERFLSQHPQADGLFMDNSTGRPPVKASDVLESVTSYGNAYGSMLNAVARAIYPRWILANTAGSGTLADPIVRQNSAYFEEFAIRPLAHNYQQFEDLAAVVAHRLDLRSPPPYAILDSMPTGGSPTDPRTQIATLAYYYLLADPVYTFLDFYGGYAPGTSWTQHWSPAAAYNIGQPEGEWSLFATGNDPSNPSLMYRVYQRQYSNALVLYKPLAYAPGATSTASLGWQTATVHYLGGWYRPLQADGTLGAPVNTISLRNGEGAILIKV